MLYTKTINPTLLELLNRIMAVDAFKDFYLVGGTSLALQLGHRNSIDIDLFGRSEIEEIEFTDILNTIGDVVILKKSKSILVYSINGIKVDFVNYNYPWLEEPEVIQNIRLASKADIGAMKLNAIAGRGSKKDFIDLYELLQLYSLSEIIEFYNQKYHDGSVFLVIKSLNYFDDADLDEAPLMYRHLEWESIKGFIKEAVQDYLSER